MTQLFTMNKEEAYEDNKGREKNTKTRCFSKKDPAVERGKEGREKPEKREESSGVFSKKIAIEVIAKNIGKENED